jgi:hypothetical protein
MTRQPTTTITHVKGHQDSNTSPTQDQPLPPAEEVRGGGYTPQHLSIWLGRFIPIPKPPQVPTSAHDCWHQMSIEPTRPHSSVKIQTDAPNLY